MDLNGWVTSDLEHEPCHQHGLFARPVGSFLNMGMKSAAAKPAIQTNVRTLSQESALELAAGASVAYKLSDKMASMRAERLMTSSPPGGIWVRRTSVCTCLCRRINGQVAALALRREFQTAQ